MNQVEVRFTAGSKKATRDLGRSWKIRSEVGNQQATLKYEISAL
jgi:hypothetical protein